MMLSASPGSLAAPAWRDISAAESAAGPGTPGPARHIAIDRVGVRSRLNAARLQGSGYIELPAPVGSRYFRITETPVLAPALARRHPGIRTYTGVDISEPATTLKLALTPAGFTAQVMGPEGSYYVDPVRGHADRHILYTRRDRGRKSMPPPRCAVEGHAASAPAGSALPRGRATNEAAQAAAASALASGAVLSEYRLAVAATGQYTAYHGGTVAGALAAIATAVNRVNGIFERDVAVRFTLIEENEQIIYTDAATDPYSGGSASALAEQNQNNLDAVLPPTAYDIGQVFSTNNTGFAFFGVACRLTLKARGASGATAPDSDSFYVDIVAHELAHQLDARHTFNGTAGQCGANRSANDAYEPGSGSTIMAYAGICNGDNLKLRTDDYFHTHSFEQMVSYTTTGHGSVCAATTLTGNQPPIVDAGPTGLAIPVGTPFELIGSATDPDGDPLAYRWEQHDLGPQGPVNEPSGNAPIFRSFPARSTPRRLFPKSANLLAGTVKKGEILPAYARALEFRLTAQDNRTGGGGVDFDTVNLSVVDTGAPFRVTAPVAGATWPGLSTQTVTWDVAGTDAAPIDCAAVDISFSSDGGNNFDTVLATATANDGSADVLAPNGATALARIRVKCSDNVFLNVNDGEFTTTDTPDADSDNVPDTADNCPTTPNFDQSDVDGDLSGDACDDDIDGDMLLNADDNCPGVPNVGQQDQDGDGLGDDCDSDRDGDGMPNNWETTFMLDPDDPTDALLDNDGDGFTNLYEFFVGSDPNVADSPVPIPAVPVPMLWLTLLSIMMLARRALRDEAMRPAAPRG